MSERSLPKQEDIAMIKSVIEERCESRGSLTDWNELNKVWKVIKGPLLVYRLCRWNGKSIYKTLSCLVRLKVPYAESVLLTMNSTSQRVSNEY